VYIVRINVILRRVRLTIFGVESNKYYIFLVWVCSFRYPACNTDCIFICGPYGSTIFFHIIS